jgi:hypothetical protein
VTTTQNWIGKFAAVKDPGTPGWGPEGVVTYPEGIGGFIVASDDRGRPVVRLTHFYGKSNRNLAEYGEVAFQIEDLHVGDGVRSWGEDDHRKENPEAGQV